MLPDTLLALTVDQCLRARLHHPFVLPKSVEQADDSCTRRRGHDILRPYRIFRSLEKTDRAAMELPILTVALAPGVGRTARVGELTKTVPPRIPRDGAGWLPALIHRD
jgi:hypothetical protein